MATDELLQEQWKSAGVGLSSSMPALAPIPRPGSRCRPYRCGPVWRPRGAGHALGFAQENGEAVCRGSRLVSGQLAFAIAISTR
jgi:hypothetical protein